MRIVTRSQWGARAPQGTSPRPLGEVQGICYHHTVTPQPSLTRSGARIVREVQAMHMTGRGYSDIAYNALIGPGGKVYEGRSLEVVGAHSDGTWHGQSANRVLLSIAFIGNYQTDELSAEAKQAALAVEYLWALKLGRALDITAHRNTKATACPGDHVAAWLASRGL